MCGLKCFLCILTCAQRVFCYADFFAFRWCAIRLSCALYYIPTLLLDSLLALCVALDSICIRKSQSNTYTHIRMPIPKQKWLSNDLVWLCQWLCKLRYTLEFDTLRSVELKDFERALQETSLKSTQAEHNKSIALQITWVFCVGAEACVYASEWAMISCSNFFLDISLFFLSHNFAYLQNLYSKEQKDTRKEWNRGG